MSHDSGVVDPQQCFIFGMESNLVVLENSPHWFTDGTFNMATRLFYQVTTMHASRGKRGDRFAHGVYFFPNVRLKRATEVHWKCFVVCKEIETRVSPV